MKPILAVPFLGATLLISGCSDDGGATPAGPRAAAAAAHPARPAAGSAVFEGVTCFDVAESDGVLHLLVGRPDGDEDKAVALSYTRSDDGGATWSRPVAVSTAHAPPAHLHRGDDPQLAARGARLMAAWPAKGDGPYGSGPIGVAVSEDGGRTWHAAESPAARPLAAAASATPRAAALVTGTGSEAPAASDKTGGAGKHKHAAPATGPGYRFPAVAAGPDAFHLVWIYASGEERSLRHARLGFNNPRGSWSDDVVIDPQICACCWNDLRVAGDGTLCALYRDVQPSDMAMAASRDGGATWRPAGRPGPFGWQFDGCPHVGGGLTSITGAGGTSEWLATVWTGAAKSAGAHATASGGENGGGSGAHWSQPLPLGENGRNTDVAFHESSGVALAVWDQTGGEAGQSVFGAVSRDGGRTWGTPRELSRAGQNAAYPRVNPTRDGFLVAWTEYGINGASALATRAAPAAEFESAAR